MRISTWAGGLAMLALVSCAPTTPTAPVASSTNGVILAVRAVRDVGPARLPRLMPELSPSPVGQVEYVVRTSDGVTLAVVQEADPHLAPGAAVTVSRGEKAGLRAR